MAGNWDIALAHVHAAAPAFNSLFYATAATVIPVLFLAVAVRCEPFGPGVQQPADHMTGGNARICRIECASWLCPERRRLRW
jgi:hypothetical protein